MPTFRTHAERMKHPQAKLIPSSMWSDFELFHESLNDTVLSLMKAKDTLLMSTFSASVLKLNNQWLKKQAWLSIALSHPVLNLSKLQQIANMLQLSNTTLFSLLTILGNLTLLKEFITLHRHKAQEMIADNEFYACRKAAENGHLKVLIYLETIVPSLISEMIKAVNFAMYKESARNGHSEFLIHLETQAPTFILRMLRSDNFYAFRLAAANGHIEVLKHIDVAAPYLIKDMIAADNYFAYCKATENGHLETSKWLLSKSSDCLAYAEMHMHEYGEQSIRPFITQRLNVLHREALNIPAQGVFDIADPEQAKICFYMIRNLIRRNDRTLDDEIRFLLNIPSVKTLVLSEVTVGQPNELIRLAITTGNHEAAAILLNIPQIRALTEQNDFYRAEANGRLDIAQLARDRESSMTALTRGEQKRLNDVIRNYRPIIKDKGVINLMNVLREQLKQRYESNPAKITNSQGKTITLPMDFAHLQKLRLNSVEYQQALKAYYQHKDHTAWRYMEKPNPWMNPEASYVYRNRRTGQKWSTFEEYQPLIILFWLAARDQKIPPAEGHTLETQLDHFIDELALIGRAHNWDQTRTSSKGKEEEYDDLTGDKPSCFSGVKRRLFQSVWLTVLTDEMILEEIRYFARTHLESKIRAEDTTLLKNAFDDYLINTNDLSENSKTMLIALNIPDEKQHTFEHYLSLKYGTQYVDDFHFYKLVRDKLYLEPGSKDFLSQCHVLMLDGLAGLYQMLEKSTKASEMGFFKEKKTGSSFPSVSESPSREH